MIKCRECRNRIYPNDDGELFHLCPAIIGLITDDKITSLQSELETLRADYQYLKDTGLVRIPTDK